MMMPVGLVPTQRNEVAMSTDASKPTPNNSELMQLSCSGDEALRIVNRAVLDLWDVVNELTRLRPKKLQHYYVTIFGSARIQQGTQPYEEVCRLAEQLARLGCQIVTGGGPGLMQAANEGARRGDPGDADGSVGIRVSLPFEQDANAFVGRVYEHKTFFTRLHHFIVLSDAFIVVPGGIGTALELFMVWQLLQVRHLYDKPFILVGKMYEDLVKWAREHMVETAQQLANPIDMTIPQCVPTIDEALELIESDYRRWKQP